MADKGLPRSYKKFVDKTIVCWQKILCLTLYDIVVNYADSDTESSTESAIFINQVYYTATITLYPAHLNIWKSNLPEARKIIIHELTHILTEHFWEFTVEYIPNKEKEEFVKIGEQLVESLAKILSRNIGQVK